LIIDIHLHKRHSPLFSLFIRELFEERRDGFAGAAPVGVEVGDYVGVCAGYGGEVGLGGYFGDFGGGGHGGGGLVGEM